MIKKFFTIDYEGYVILHLDMETIYISKNDVTTVDNIVNHIFDRLMITLDVNSLIPIAEKIFKNHNEIFKLNQNKRFLLFNGNSELINFYI